MFRGFRWHTLQRVHLHEKKKKKNKKKKKKKKTEGNGRVKDAVEMFFQHFIFGKNYRTQERGEISHDISEISVGYRKYRKSFVTLSR